MCPYWRWLLARGQSIVAVLFDWFAGDVSLLDHCAGWQRRHRVEGTAVRTRLSDLQFPAETAIG